MHKKAICIYPDSLASSCSLGECGSLAPKRTWRCGKTKISLTETDCIVEYEGLKEAEFIVCYSVF